MQLADAYRVYVIQNPRARRYIGLSENPSARLAQHHAGKSKWTAKHCPWKLIWMNAPLNFGDARELENLLKRQKGGGGLRKILSTQGEFVSPAPGS